MPHNIVGPPVQDDNFFGREQELQRINDYLRQHSLLLLAPRRVGKTSLLHALGTQSQAKEYRTLYLSAESIHSVADLLDKLYHRVKELLDGQYILKFGHSVQNKLCSIKEIPWIKWEPSADMPWQQRWEKLQELLADQQNPWLIMIDELPLLILRLLGSQKKAEAEWLLHSLRSLRITYTHTRWIFCGSISLDSVSELYQLTPSINDLYRFALGPYSEETARRLLNALSSNYQIPITEEGMQALLLRCGWLIPYYLQLLFDQLRQERSPVTAQRVEQAFQSLLAPANKGYFSHWHDRLEIPGAGAKDRALRILAHCAEDPQGVTEQSLTQSLGTGLADPESRWSSVQQLLDLLHRDGYLVADAERWRFRSPLLREFWLRNIVRRNSNG
ncbi:AAA family ATPase [Candidatus Magnetaquicoccus inordinatus]|uniref:AAA family ATPase n=1 Tax=Candidatus Magnetaquicoccus inordinatus TaxID=2496818 RepID=UPI00102C62AB|nr:AAA family ATPase [Candidatus Magnetaquicoccus inordinatus]